MTPNRSSVPENRGQGAHPQPDSSMSWGERQSESEDVSRARSRPGADDGLVRCPSCGSEKTTLVRPANREADNSIRRDNPGFTCFACGTGWTVTIAGDHDPEQSSSN
ncbi:hypothetical protein ABEG17_05295 [Pedococcus sp. KACC 23699]|uniref:Small CPxCG-related zinc finger protein n=1 Tax=Pedococcus sp. KACC 23699 TaxID=3149228 RepID=A0AAU7JWH1_9MICO